MIRLITKTLILGCLVLLTYGLLWLWPVKPQLVYASILDKHARLDALDAPRLIFTGGSGVALGLDSKLIEEETGMPVINMGVNAGFGLRYLVAELSPTLRAGDIVVIVPEYETFFGSSMEGGQNLLWALQIWGWRAWSHFDLSKGQINTIVSQLPYFMQNRFMEILPAPIDPIYNRAAFTERGDFVNHLALPSRTIRPYTIDPEQQLNHDAIALLNDFAQAASGEGARIVLLPPAIARSFYNYEENVRTIDAIFRSLEAVSSLTMLAHPAMFVLDDTLFFDTVYHLNQVGRKMRTRLVIQQLYEKGIVIQ